MTGVLAVGSRREWTRIVAKRALNEWKAHGSVEALGSATVC